MSLDHASAKLGNILYRFKGKSCRGALWAKRDAEGEEIPLDNVCPSRRAASYGRGHFSLRPISDALLPPSPLRCFMPRDDGRTGNPFPSLTDSPLAPFPDRQDVR